MTLELVRREYIQLGIIILDESRLIYSLRDDTYTQEKYEKAMASLAETEKRVVIAESMLEATLQYESGQSKAQSSPGYMKISWHQIYSSACSFIPCNQDFW